MTTPERLRRRQRWELGLVLAVLVGSLIYGYVDSKREQSRDECLVTLFKEAAANQQVRGDLATQTFSLIDRKINVLVRVVENIAAAQDQNDVAEAFVKFQRGKLRIDEQADRVSRKRTQAEPPKFPDGTCE